MDREKAAEITDPKRVRNFARFFKRYMNISSVITAALPVPVTALGAIPTFKAQTTFLSVYTALFCFLALGFIFYSRHQLARLMFPEHFRDQLAYIQALSSTTGRMFRSWRFFVAFLPLLLIIISMVSLFWYHDFLDESINMVRARSTDEASSAESILATTQLGRIYGARRLIFSYLVIFLAAESAFMVMAIKEYLQDLVGLSEMDLILGPPKLAAETSSADAA